LGAFCRHHREARSNTNFVPRVFRLETFDHCLAILFKGPTITDDREFSAWAGIKKTPNGVIMKT
jgi:hypothetical protein